jgi:hypothetical protein
MGTPPWLWGERVTTPLGAYPERSGFCPDAINMYYTAHSTIEWWYRDPDADSYRCMRSYTVRMV